MRVAYRFITPLLLLASLSCDNEPLIKERKNQVVLIFSDVTTSLVPQENEKVANLTADVIDALAPGTIYRVYPLQIDSRIDPIRDSKILNQSTEQGDKAIKAQRRKELIRELAELYELIRPVKDRNVTYGKADNHTCILNTLRIAEQQLRQYEHAKYDVELVYISDMIEECNRPDPIGQPVMLAKSDISNEISMASKADLKLDFSAVRVTIIIPATKESYTMTERPSLDQVRKFWEAIFRHCGFTDSSLADNNRFYFSVGLPQRFKP